jgi:hypothetical protein
MDSLFLFLENLFLYLGKEPFISLFLLYALYTWTKFIANKIQEKDWFSDKYVKTMYWVFGFVFLFAFLGGTLQELKHEFRLGLQEPGDLFFNFLPFFFGTLIGATALAILITYLIRLVIPFLKKVHERANK